MSFFLWNILLAVNWALLAGHFTLMNLLSGYVLGFLLLWMLRSAFGGSEYFLRVRRAVEFGGVFLWQLVKANISVAQCVLLKRVEDIHPAFIAIPLEAKSDAEIALLANLITLTPGTLSLDVAEDRSVLYIHTLDVADIEALRTDIKKGLERPLLEVIR